MLCAFVLLGLVSSKDAPIIGWLLSADNWRLKICRLPINTKSYNNLTFLLFEIENKLLIVIPALRITVKPALGDHTFVKLKVVAQNRWLLNEGSLTGTGIVTIVSLWLLIICHPVSRECRQDVYQLCKWRSADTIIIIGRYQLSANYRCIFSFFSVLCQASPHT